ncbi:hypothetical protein IIA15_06915 [candidate division TA06 bacterium]|nr:hypothetical protein [candidate division TA06 bacterium]
MKSFIFFVGVIGVVFLLALNFHVVKTKDGTLYVKKGRMTFEDTFVNINGWDSSKLSRHNLLEEDLLASGHEDLVDEIKYPKREERALQPPPSSYQSTSDILLESGSSGSGTGQSLKKRARDLKGK